MKPDYTETVIEFIRKAGGGRFDSVFVQNDSIYTPFCDAFQNNVSRQLFGSEKKVTPHNPM